VPATRNFLEESLGRCRIGAEMFVAVLSGRA
jgi:hypothetical protein